MLQQICSPLSAFRRIALLLAVAHVGLWANGVRLTSFMSEPAVHLAKLPGDTLLVATICQGETYFFGGQPLTLSGIYTQILTASDGTDSLVTLNLTVLPTAEHITSITLCHGETYTFNGETYGETGVYVDTLTAANGCDSIDVLELLVRPAIDTQLHVRQCVGTFFLFAGDTLTTDGVYSDTLTSATGCDSVVLLHLRFVAFFETHLNKVLCKGDTIFFAGDTLTSAGIYTDTLTALGGCDSILVLRLRETQPQFLEIQANICADEVYVWGTDTLSESGVFTRTLTGSNGCDSTVQLTLTVFPNFQEEIVATICAGETYEFAGEELDQSVTYTSVLTSQQGCDSIITLHLTVLPAIESDLFAEICGGDVYEWNGETFDETGLYAIVLEAANGCDSTVHLHLSVLPTFENHLSASICAGEAYDFHGTPLEDAGTYFFHLTAQNGCDSTVILELEVLPEITTEIAATICAGETYVFQGDTLTQSGSYSVLLSSQTGCDSIVNLDLIVLPEISSQIAATTCAGEPYLLGNQMFNTSGTFEVVFQAESGCDSTVVLTLTVLPASATELSASFCENEAYSYFGQLLNTPGEYSFIFQAENGCDSVVTLHLTALPTAFSTQRVTICSGDIFELNGETYDDPGFYDFYYTAQNGCDSIFRLELRVLPRQVTQLSATICVGNSIEFNGQTLDSTGIYSVVLQGSNGCDSTVTLRLQVVEKFETELAASICAGNSYLFNGEILNEAGSYTQIFTSVGGCDSVVTLMLTLLPATASSVDASICAGETYSFFGQPLTTQGTYTTVLKNANGCDSVVTLTLTVLPNATSSLSAIICEGETYSFHGQLLQQSGDYTAHFTSANGCDSAVVLSLTVLPASVSISSAVICEGETYSFFGQELTQSGVYSEVLKGMNGCDSVVVLELEVQSASLTVISAAICQGETYFFAGENLFLPGFYFDVMTNSFGCDSVILLELEVLPTSAVAIQQSICEGESYAFGGQNLTTSGTYSATFSNAYGCDSVVTLTLRVLPKSATTLNAAICEGESYAFGGQNLTAPGTYSAAFSNAYGCDSVVTLTLTVKKVDNRITLTGAQLSALATHATFQWINCDTQQPIPGATAAQFTPTQNGNYAVQVTQDGCTAQSECLFVMVVRADAPFAGGAWQLAPNPAISGEIWLQWEKNLPNIWIMNVLDNFGRIMLSQEIPAGTDRFRIDLATLPAGNYSLQLTDGAKRISSVKKFVVLKN